MSEYVSKRELIERIDLLNEELLCRCNKLDLERVEIAASDRVFSLYIKGMVDAMHEVIRYVEGLKSQINQLEEVDIDEAILEDAKS